MSLEVGADEAGGFFKHTFHTYVSVNQEWTSPLLRARFGADVRTALAEYAAAHGFVRGLRDKMKQETLNKFRSSVLVKYEGGTFKEQIEGLERLPSPSIVHLVDYLRGGFDKQYPDHLPPHPSKGTAEEFLTLIKRAQALGHLVMPYTNPTWWCDDPKGPTFEKHGDAPLLRRLDGNLNKEDYWGNWGWSICPWHPAVIEANRRIREQFTREFPVDILFQDQVGARRFLYDLNPAAPTPYAYMQGIINIAKIDSEFIPLSTEDGFDKLINYESQFCGITWRLGPREEVPSWLAGHSYGELFDASVWEFFPLGQYLAHDKVVFAHHNLGKFVTNKLQLSWTLALGYQLSYAISPHGLHQPHHYEWLRWLDRVQKSVAANYIGEKLNSFRYLAGSGDKGVMEAQFNNLRIIANVKDEPYVLSSDVVIAPQGFYVEGITDTDSRLYAGILKKWLKQGYGEDELWFVLESGKDLQRLWVYVPNVQEVTLPKFKAVKVEVEGGGNAKVVRQTDDSITLRIIPPQRLKRVAIPKELQGVAPIRRTKPPRFIGLLNLKPESPRLYGWTGITAQQWRQALEQSALVKTHRLSIQVLESIDQLLQALQQPQDYFAIINPYGEKFPARSVKQMPEMLAAIKRYVENGGIWWETAGYPFYYAMSPANGTWQQHTIGYGGLDALGISGCKMLPADEPSCELEATPEGSQWLGAALSEDISYEEAVVNRPPKGDDYNIIIINSPNGPYIVGYQLNGWGFLFRICGGNPPPKVAFPVVTKVLEHLLKTPPQQLPVKSPFRQLVSVTLRKP